MQMGKLVLRQPPGASDAMATPSSAKAGQSSGPRPRTLAEFRKQHDIPEKIRVQVRRLGDGYVTEDELRQLCGVAVANWRRNAELPEFSNNKLRLDGVTYWATERTITAMKQITGRA